MRKSVSSPMQLTSSVETNHWNGTSFQTSRHDKVPAPRRTSKLTVVEIGLLQVRVSHAE